MTYCVRLMCRDDVLQVNDIDREAFCNWRVSNYEHELNNQLAHYIVVSDEMETAPVAASENGFSRFRSRLRQLVNHGSSEVARAPGRILGFAGFWVMAGEAHIISIAVREAYRHRGIGELLLIFLFDLALELKASIVTLEVRASNVIAQNLYRKFGFSEVGVRRGYYTDNGENAILMSTESTDSASFQLRLKELKLSLGTVTGS